MGCRQPLSDLAPDHVCTAGSLTPRVLDLLAPGWYVDMRELAEPLYFRAKRNSP
jgi:hypothetical protein